MNGLPDHDLRRHFGELCAADAARAPDFRELLDRENRAHASMHRDERSRLARLAIPIALAAAVAVAVGIAGVARRRAVLQAPLSTWTSPTAGLLRTSGLGVLGPTNNLSSTLSSSLLSKGTRP